ncbi:hypothetical protein TraAM80_06390 [Trypanosoma rangeli]|uniref:Uncharacterized protein n=1 Tax=Trypanosoma rangeli TaxID=5698 RepID=A0A3R7NGU7_TRYRA|nr:uncharacterized protein TraAM80_06390 [Trypanosoma rangeli]RNF02493.1 hypothetical protein TraAM80_06390 [Trypanosoma rangeli]|eukprot:RNF02493.1 hypothetical protein TraAM80_06390 [Trypanosoma rangeli]
MISESDWCVVGRYRWRSISQRYAHLEEQSLYDDAGAPENIPIIFYDTRQEDGKTLAPLYVARKVLVPQASSKKAKVISGCTQPQSTMPVMPLDPSVNCGTSPVASVSRHPENFPLVVGTTLPVPLHTIFLVLITVLLGDIAVTAAGMTTTSTSSSMTAVCCLATLGPDVISIGLILNRGRNSAFAAIHVVLWPCFLILFILPFISKLFIVHILFSVVLLLFLVRFRMGTYTTFFTF